MKQCNKTKKEIYDLLVGTHSGARGFQFSASKVAKFLGVSKSYVTKVIKEFIDEDKIIRCINPNEYIKLYEATFRPFDGTYSVTKEAKKKEVNLPQPSCEVVLQKARYKITISREYTDFFEKQRHIWHGKAAARQFRTKIFDEFGKWTFEKQGKNTLIIMVPEMFFARSHLEAARITIFSIVYEAIKWFCKHAHITVNWNTLHQCQKPHVTKKAMSSKAKRICRNFSLNIDGKMLDMSSGDADFESTVLDTELVDAIDILETWDVSGHFEKRINEVVLNYTDFAGRLDKVELKQKKFVKKIDKVIEVMSELKAMIESVDVKEMDPEDPMYT